MEGWISIHRKIFDNDIWGCEPFSRGQAWIDLLLLANYKDSYFYVRGVKVDVLRGQVGISESKLSARWQWSRTKLRKFLNDLEKEQQIIQQKNNVTQVITLVNYDEYQKKEQQTGQQKDVNNKYSIESMEGFVIFYKNILSLFPEIFRPNNKTKQSDWIDCLDKLVRLDKYNLDTIFKISKWARDDEFWTKQFQSILKLRRTNKDGIPFHVVFMEKYKESMGSQTRYKKLGDEIVRL